MICSVALFTAVIAIMAQISIPMPLGVTACVVPFIPTAIIKAVAAAVIGLQIRKRLVNILYA